MHLKDKLFSSVLMSHCQLPLSLQGGRSGEAVFKVIPFGSELYSLVNLMSGVWRGIKTREGATHYTTKRLPCSKQHKSNGAGGYRATNHY